MSDMTWERMTDLLKAATKDSYGEDARRERDKSINILRAEYLRLQTAAAESETLRDMLIKSGVESARLTVAVEQERELAKVSARRAEEAEYQLSLVTAVAGPPADEGGEVAE